MQINKVEIFQFLLPEQAGQSKWTELRKSYGLPLAFGYGDARRTTWLGIRIFSDDGTDGFFFEYRRRPPVTRVAEDGFDVEDHSDASVYASLQPMYDAVCEHLIGKDPMGIETIWQEIYADDRIEERVHGIADCALWDLKGKILGVPVYKLLGGTRDKLPAYASTISDIGTPEEYAEHARECLALGYLAYKVHPYRCLDPNTMRPGGKIQGQPDADIEIYRAVAAAVGNKMELLADPFLVYDYDGAVKVGHELERLNYAWYEDPLPEDDIDAYVRLKNELDIPLIVPEVTEGAHYTRAEWLMRGATDMLRIDYYLGGITSCWKTAALAQCHGVPCELHKGGWANAHAIAAWPETTSKYFEQLILTPGVSFYDFLFGKDKTSSCPKLKDGYIIMPQLPGLGFEPDWTYMR